MRLSRVLRKLAAIAVTPAVGVLATACMVRWSPGFGMDENRLDPRFDRATLERLAPVEGQNPWGYCLRYGLGILRGDFGQSRTFERPVAGLIAERARVTAEVAGAGLAAAWVLGGSLALVCAAWQRPAATAGAHAIAAVLLCTPSAVLAMLLFLYGNFTRAAVALLLLPRIFTYMYELFAGAYRRPHVLAARARGVRPWRLAAWHICPVAAPEGLALAGTTVTLAFGLSVPVEAFCDLPGIGQLAWKAALNRDLPVLLSLTLLVVLITQLMNAAAEFAGAAARRTAS
jgi:peptide/nickel transport system permease protein